MIDTATYATERAICDKAQAYADKIMGVRIQNGVAKRQRNFLTAEEAAHPDYAACDNAMRGRVEQYELLTNTPERFGAYVSSDGKHVTTWTGDILGTCYLGAGWRSNSWIGPRQYQATAWINGREFTGRTFGAGTFIGLRETAASARKRAA